jgi:hypothetical protein
MVITGYERCLTEGRQNTERNRGLMALEREI